MGTDFTDFTDFSDLADLGAIVTDQDCCPGENRNNRGL